MDKELNENNNNNKSADKEISLIDLFLYLGKLLVKIGNWIIGKILLFFKFCLRKKTLLLISAIIGVIIGTIIFCIFPRRYSSVLVASSVYVNNNIVIDHINKLELFIEDVEKKSEALNIPADDAQSLIELKAYYGIDLDKDGVPDLIDYKQKYNPKDTLQKKSQTYIYIKATTTKTSIFDSLGKNIIQYVQKNQYINDLYLIDKEQKKQIINQLESEINVIDSVQYTYYEMQYNRSLKSENQQMIILGNEPDLKLFYGDRLSLVHQKMANEKTLKINDDILVIMQDFIAPTQPDNPYYTYLLKYFLLAVFAALVFGAISEIYKSRKDTVSQ